MAGGTDSTSAAVGDVWAFNLNTLTWRKLGELTSARTRPAVLFVGSELWVIGGYTTSASFTSTGVPTIEAFDTTSGTRRDVTVTGSWPTSQGIFWTWAPLSAGLIAIDSGDTVDESSNQLWELVVSGSGASWNNTDPQVMDSTLNGLVGVGTCDGAWLLGANTWHVHR